MASNINQQPFRNHNKIATNETEHVLDKKSSTLGNSSMIGEINPILRALSKRVSNSDAVEHLNLKTFKVKPCLDNNEHSYKQCRYYHDFRDRRREGNHYRPEFCSFAEIPENCLHGDSCLQAHSQSEVLYHPENYKTKFCRHYPSDVELCEYGSFCPFAHSDQDIRIELIHSYKYDEDFYMFHYKTVWCPFDLIQHDKISCVYAHDCQDYRRKPHLFSYEPVICQSWKPNELMTKGKDSCPLKERCQKCHGCKEYEYHPLIYKTSLCANANCQNDSHCRFYHTSKERRIIPSNIANGLFTLAPRKRSVTETLEKGSEKIIRYDKPSEGLKAADKRVENLNEMFSEEQFNPVRANKNDQNMSDECPLNLDEVLNSDQKDYQEKKMSMDASVEGNSNGHKSAEDSVASYHPLKSFDSQEDFDREQEDKLNLSEEELDSSTSSENLGYAPYSIHDLDHPEPILSPRYSIEDRIEYQYN